MNERRSICFLLAGSTLSGAEKRTVITAIELSKCTEFKVKLITSKSLKAEFYKSDLAESDLSNLEWVVRGYSESKNAVIRRLYNLIYSLIANVIQLPKKNSCLHIVLFNELILLSLVPYYIFWKNDIYYEVTSPDVAKSLSVKLLIRLKMYKKLVSVSDGVSKMLVNMAGSEERISLYTRKQPLAYSRNEGNLIEKEKIVVFAHRLIPRKNPILAASSFVVLAREFKDWNFYICGDGDLKNEVEEIVSTAALNNLVYKGYVYDMDSLMRRSMIFVSLIQPDNYPSQSVLNALSNGNALVVSDTGESVEKFIDNNGVVVDLNERSIVEGLRSLLQKDSLINELECSVGLFERRYGLRSYIDDCKLVYS